MQLVQDNILQSPISSRSFPILYNISLSVRTSPCTSFTLYRKGCYNIAQGNCASWTQYVISLSNTLLAERVEIDNPNLEAMNMQEYTNKMLIKHDAKTAFTNLVEEVESDVIICDFDGTIAFTEGFSYEATHIVAGRFDASLSEEQWKQAIGHTDAEIWEMIREWNPDSPIPKDTLDIIADSREIYLELCESELVANDWITEHRKTDAIPYYIVSNNKENIVRRALSCLPFSVTTLFDKGVSSCADLQRSKLDVWADIIGDADPSKVIIVEDNVELLRYAISKGYVTIAVEHRYNQDKLKDLKGLALIVK